MLDDDDSVASGDERIEGIEQLAYVVEVKTRGGFVEDEDGGVMLFHSQIEGKLDALVLTARESGR